MKKDYEECEPQKKKTKFVNMQTVYFKIQGGSDSALMTSVTVLISRGYHKP